MQGFGEGPQCAARPVVRFAVVDPDQMLLDGLAAWVATVPDLWLVGASTTVAGLLAELPAAPDVLLLGLPDGPGHGPLPDLRALTQSEVYVLILCSRPDDERIAEAVRAGADGVVTRDNSLTALAGLLREIALGRQHGADGPARPGPAGQVPNLSEQERAVLLGYASGMTLSTVARRIGIRPSTAKEYLHRVKLKYEQVGRPAYTKIDLANRVREDGYERTEEPFHERVAVHGPTRRHAPAVVPAGAAGSGHGRTAI